MGSGYVRVKGVLTCGTKPAYDLRREMLHGMWLMLMTPSMRAYPERPASTLRKLVLPAPEGPMMAMRREWGKEPVTLDRMRCLLGSVSDTSVNCSVMGVCLRWKPVNEKGEEEEDAWREWEEEEGQEEVDGEGRCWEERQEGEEVEWGRKGGERWGAKAEEEEGGEER